MVAYSFQRQFVEPIRLGLAPGPAVPGAKRHTIRSIGKRRHARPGDLLQLYVGQRTRSCELIGVTRCAGAPAITLMLRDRRPRVIIEMDDEVHGMAALDAFARSDGFDDWADLRAFWAEHHPGINEFNGVMIRWEPMSLAAGRT